MEKPAVSLADVTFSYRGAGAPSLSSLSLDVAAGECVLLCGKSGCGKSTVLRLLNGMIPEFYDGEASGRVEVAGMDPASCPQYEIARSVGTVFQNPRTQFYTLNTTSEVAFGCENQGLKRAEIARRVGNAAEELGIESLMNRSIFQLSGGEKQRLAVASVYASDPEVFLLDEPSANLDFPAIRELRRILNLLKAKGKTILVAEHRTWYLEGIADRAVYLDGGRVAGIYAMEELASLTREQRLETGIRPARLDAFDVPRTSAPTELSRSCELHLRDIAFSYSRRSERSLFVGDARFGAGRIEMIVGDNGAGKSTLVSVICGLAKENRGTIAIDGASIKARKRLPISYEVMQEVNHQLFCDSVEDEVVLGAARPDASALESVLDRMDLWDVRDRHPLTLSGGQKQRCAIAAAVFCGKRVIAFDEPTSGLDYAHMAQTAELLRELAGTGIFVLVVTHDYELVRIVGDRVTEMRGGGIAGQYDLDEEGVLRLRTFFGIGSSFSCRREGGI
ncbi:ABC transporter ATP-binding protein [Slackia exigua]|uniref:ABC transporter ATP-binding protein n=1 Tax=Slackia exigua TaxID=84109 RepID=UPI00210AAA1F|nr:ABC transporter ATP-binding protein [Slackia exigua]MCQ5091011.1 ABC transporter ATP-binding protein [Slackia exigua]